MDSVDSEACRRCEYSRAIKCQDGCKIIGCNHEPFHGTWIAYIENCYIRDKIKKEIEEEEDKDDLFFW